MQRVELKPRGVSFETNEEIKYLRSNIQFSGVDKKVILATSVTSNEGKSTIVLELAKAMAEMGKRVLLIDSDLRKSVFKSKVTEPEAIKRGLSHLLSGMVTVNDALCVTGEPVFYIIPAGPVPPNPSELMSNRRMDDLLTWARDKFDYVFVDTPPLGAVIDAAVVAPKCDGAIFIVEAERIPRTVAQSVVTQLLGAGCPVLGAVLNKVNTTKGRYYDHYYRKGGYGDTQMKKKGKTRK